MAQIELRIVRYHREQSAKLDKLKKFIIEKYEANNTIIKMRTRLKSLFLFFYKEELTTNRPFDGVKIGTAKVGTPIYITIE